MRPAVSLKEILLAIAVVTVSFFVSLKTMDWLRPRGAIVAPVLVELPPLPAAPRSSSILAPVAIALNANAEIKGNVTITARPKLAAAWRIEPNLAAQVDLGDTSLSLAGARVNVPAQVKPLIDKTVADQLTAMQERIRNDPSLERNARAQWAKACRSIPLQGTGAASSLPALWLELRPTRAIAAQPRVDASAVTLTLGVEAETRITSVQTRPDCPFPAKVTIIPPTPGGVRIGVPIDLPFTDINKIVAAQFAGRTFPEDGSGSVDVTVKRASVAASGDRLLISLLVNAKEKKSLFGLGGEANVH